VGGRIRHLQAPRRSTLAVIPVVKCERMSRSILFYTWILDFELASIFPGPADPAYALLTRDGDELHLSSQPDDGIAGQSVLILTKDVDAVFAGMKERGFVPPDQQDSPLHQGPVDQTWGTREFAVDDPDGNTICFVQR
jgi:catechol 2,3-dioxygenase-like lactoylglutathione lyase family enzyme